jgi:hypothetical protein
LGFLGVTVITRVQTPRFWGQDFKAGDFVLWVTCDRPKRTNWLIVGIRIKLLQDKTRLSGQAQKSTLIKNKRNEFSIY